MERFDANRDKSASLIRLVALTVPAWELPLKALLLTMRQPGDEDRKQVVSKL